LKHRNSKKQLWSNRIEN